MVLKITKSQWMKFSLNCENVGLRFFHPPFSPPPPPHRHTAGTGEVHCHVQWLTAVCSLFQENPLHWRSNHCPNGRSPAPPYAHPSRAPSPERSKYLEGRPDSLLHLNVSNIWGHVHRFSQLFTTCSLLWRFFFCFIFQRLNQMQMLVVGKKENWGRSRFSSSLDLIWWCFYFGSGVRCPACCLMQSVIVFTRHTFWREHASLSGNH